MPGTSTDISGPATHLRGRRGREGSHFFLHYRPESRWRAAGLKIRPERAYSGLFPEDALIRGP